jgi:hypothetical protein
MTKDFRVNRSEPKKSSIVKSANGVAVPYTVRHDDEHLDRIMTEDSLKGSAAAFERVQGEIAAEDD